jgi:hypothetical protein
MLAILLFMVLLALWVVMFVPADTGRKIMVLVTLAMCAPMGFFIYNLLKQNE